jgi:hypothetical protein
MAEDSSGTPEGEKTTDSRQKEHERRNQLQAELLRKAHERSRHGAFIDAALRRARGEPETEETNHHRNVTER